MDIKPIGYVKSPYKSKFGIPRQSGIVSSVSCVVFNDEYRIAEAFRGLEKFSHIWVLWEFSEIKNQKWTPTVRPPKLGGNKRVGVFATRSPYRPNSIGLSSAQLLEIDYNCENAPVLKVKGLDVLDGTPVYDIKPYLPYTDICPQATGKLDDMNLSTIDNVVFNCECNVDNKILKDIIAIIKHDPRPAYHSDERMYGMDFDKYNIKFKVVEKTAYVTQLK